MDIPAFIENNKTLIIVGVAAVAAIVIMKKLR